MIGPIQPLDSWDPSETLLTFYRNTYACNYQGRTMQKCEDDQKRYKELVRQTQPQLVIEVGTRYGGSALWFSQECNLDVISIDVDPMLPTKSSYTMHPRIQYVVGNSVDRSLIANVQAMVQGRRTMVSLDGDHHANHVWEEIALYGALVSSGCDLVVEDGCFDMWTGEDARRGGRQIPEQGGPLKAVNLASLDRDLRWERDTEIEGLTSVSHSPAGWWRRR